MSFNFFLHAFPEVAGLEALRRSDIEREFGSFAVTRGTEFWDLTYADGDVCELYVTMTAPMLPGFMVSGPPADDRFWWSLIRLMETTPTCLFWPGGGLVIASPLLRPHVPEDMIETLGEPLLVSEPQHILAAIKAT